MTTFTDDELAALRVVAEAATHAQFGMSRNWAEKLSVVVTGANAVHANAFSPPTALRLLAELAAARATIARCEALLGKWGQKISDYRLLNNMIDDIRADEMDECWNKLSAALRPPATPAPVFTAAEWEAEKQLDYQMDLQDDADRGAEA